jgi:hypothetical protein
MTRDELLALAARVEAATGADRELDYAVAAAFDWPDSPFMRQNARRYTESLDAAASLVPKEWRWSVETLSSAGPLALCEHWPPSGPRHPHTRGEAATPALTLTAACLRAKAQEAGDE